MPDSPEHIGQVRTTFDGGDTDYGRIEFYEYSRSAYALARLISTVEAFRRTGRVPERIVGAANVEIYTYLPEPGSWTYVTELAKYAAEKVKLSVGFNALFAWTAGKSLDNLDLYNSNSDAIIAQKEDVDLALAEATLETSVRKRRRSGAGEDDAGSPGRLTKAALQKAKNKNDKLKVGRNTRETDVAVARKAKDYLDNSPQSALDEAKREVSKVEAIASRPGVKLFDEEANLLNSLSDYAERQPGSPLSAASIASRLTYAANDLGPRLTRRSLGDRIGFAEVGADFEQAERLAAKARPLLKELVLPLRKSPEDLSLSVGNNRKILHIDKVRGRMISDSVLSDETFEINVFVIEYNRVAHTGKCKIISFGIDVPFSLRRQLINRLNNQAIDSLKEDERVFIARAYLDDDGSIRSLLIEDIV